MKTCAMLWLAVGQGICGLLEIVKDGGQFGVSVLNDDGCIKPFSFNNSVCGTDDETFCVSMSSES